MDEDRHLTYGQKITLICYGHELRPGRYMGENRPQNGRSVLVTSEKEYQDAQRENRDPVLLGWRMRNLEEWRDGQ